MCLETVALGRGFQHPTWLQSPLRLRSTTWAISLACMTKTQEEFCTQKLGWGSQAPVHTVTHQARRLTRLEHREKVPAVPCSSPPELGLMNLLCGWFFSTLLPIINCNQIYAGFFASSVSHCRLLKLRVIWGTPWICNRCQKWGWLCVDWMFLCTMPVTIP